MGVVLRESAHSGESVQFAALFVAIDRAEFGKAQRQFAVPERGERGISRSGEGSSWV